MVAIKLIKPKSLYKHAALTFYAVGTVVAVLKPSISKKTRKFTLKKTTTVTLMEHFQ